MRTRDTQPTPGLIEEKWGRTVDMVIDGGPGNLGMSTVVDCTGDGFTVNPSGNRNPGILKSLYRVS